VSLLSVAYCNEAKPICFKLLIHCVALAELFALLKAGRSIEARIAMMAITTSNSISVKPRPPSARAVGRSIGSPREPFN
jgi:hypothetical protein